jgi:anti-anti-sigma regulatory factor
MLIKKLPGNIILVELSSDGLKVSEELRELNESVSLKGDCNVVLDFSLVEIINSSNISNLLILQDFLDKNGRKLILYKVQTVTRCIFVVAGLTDSFIFIDKMEDILKSVHLIS